MSLTGRNPTIRLSIIRSQIDKQQQVIALLENRLQEAILGGTDVGDIYGDQDLDGGLGEIAKIYGDNGTIDSKYGYVPDPATGAATTEIMQLNIATGETESVNSDPNLIAVRDSAKGAYQFFNADGEVNVDEYARYQQDYAKAYGGALLDPADPNSAITPPPGRADSEGINAAELLPTYTGLTGAMHKGVLDFQQVDAAGQPLPLEQDGIRQLLYQARALMGELRVEEQHWNAEVNEEKSRRKELIDFTKG
ncbi:MAG: hypothetical protein O3C63_07460 [Cyanobacteria bacterium]|nr:hypothetical protein [Cyanobacteriota bacterium]